MPKAVIPVYNPTIEVVDTADSELARHRVVP